MASSRTPLVSVVIPTYNRAHLLGRSISSVLGQTHEDLEVVVVDDGSTDQTADELAAVTDPRVRIVPLTTNQGQCRARNEGIAVARGRYVAFCDSDDEWLPTKLQKQLATFGGDESPGASYTGMWIDDGTERSVHIADVEGRAFDRLLALAGAITTSGIVVDRSVAGDELYFDESLGCSEERDLLIRVSRSHVIARVAEPLYVRYLHDGPHVAEMLGFARAWTMLLEKYKDDFDRRPHAAAYVHFRIALILHKSRDRSGARREISAASMLDPSDRRLRAMRYLSRLGDKGASIGISAYIGASKIRNARPAVS